MRRVGVGALTVVALLFLWSVGQGAVDAGAAGASF